MLVEEYMSTVISHLISTGHFLSCEVRISYFLGVFLVKCRWKCFGELRLPWNVGVVSFLWLYYDSSLGAGFYEASHISTEWSDFEGWMSQHSTCLVLICISWGGGGKRYINKICSHWTPVFLENTVWDGVRKSSIRRISLLLHAQCLPAPRTDRIESSFMEPNVCKVRILLTSQLEHRFRRHRSVPPQ